ncbi:MAG: hypothetical protein U5N86_03495 [Planctomycetota bacterium]|nr:hypothetical protein [Planctomycetota bacterium]
MFNGNLKNYMVSAGLYFAAPLGLAVASAFAETWQFAAVLVALLLLWLVLFASLRTGVFARFVLYAMLPVLTVAFSAQQMLTLGAVSLCSFAVFTAIYLPRDECLTFLRVLRFLALAVIIPVAVLFCWFAFTGFLPMLTGFILLIGWIAWFFLASPLHSRGSLCGGCSRCLTQQ